MAESKVLLMSQKRARAATFDAKPPATRVIEQMYPTPPVCQAVTMAVPGKPHGGIATASSMTRTESPAGALNGS